MRVFALSTTAILGLVLVGSIINPSCAVTGGGDERTFTARFDKLGSSGYAEIVEQRRYAKARFVADCRIWFSHDARYRSESGTIMSDSVDSGDREYRVYDGRHLYAAVANRRSTREAKWQTLPVTEAEYFPLGVCMPDSWEVSNARLIGSERVLGLPAEHWKGLDRQGRWSRDVWVSTDGRFPLVLRVLERSRDAAIEWRITKLDLDHRVPDYIFTPQVHPKPEFLRILTTRHKPPLLTLLWYVMTFLAYAGGVASFAWKRPSLVLSRRIALGAAALAGFTLLVIWGPSQETYTRTFSGTPMVVAYALLCTLLILVMLKVFGQPGGAAWFKGTTAFSLALVLGAAYLGVTMAERYPWYYYGLRHSLSIRFFPGILVKAVLGMGCITALEELIFRGYLFNTLEAALRRTWAVILLQAIIFGLYHIPGKLAVGNSLRELTLNVAWLFGSGVLFGVLRWRYRNLGVPWLVHFAYNATWLYVVTLYMDYITRFIVRP